jgi:AcrR family transcriptional regulator
MLRSQQVEATRRAVLAAARSSFGRKGYAQTSVDEIAAAARVTKGAVYHHFAGKKALFRAVHAEVEAEALARTAAAADPRGSPIDQIVAQVGAYLDVALDEEIQQITDRYRCVTLDLPLGAHPRPLSAEADRSATSLARLLLDCLELLRRRGCHGGRQRHGRRTTPALARH